MAVGFYPESVLYGNGKDTLPIDEQHVAETDASDGSIILGQRVLGLSHYGGESRDTVITVEINGEVRCFCKAKHQQARAVGVQYDPESDTYFIDRILPND